MLAALSKQGYSNALIARITDRHRSTIGREFRRNCAKLDGAYRHNKAQERTNGRRSRSRRNSHFAAPEWQLVDHLLREKFSPEQAAAGCVSWRSSTSVTRRSTRTSVATKSTAERCGRTFGNRRGIASVTGRRRSAVD
jgi:IS30 family transposase